MKNKSLLKVVLYSQLCLLTMITLCSEGDMRPNHSNRPPIPLPRPAYLDCPEVHKMEKARYSEQENLDNALCEAILDEEELSTVKTLHEKGANINTTIFSNSAPPLMLAAYSPKNTSIVDWLLTSKADINQQDCRGNTALHAAACEDNNHETVRLLLQSKADTSVLDVYQNTPLIAAIKRLKCDRNSGIPVTIQLLVQAKGDINAQNVFGNTALHETAKKNSFALIRFLLSCKADDAIRNHEGLTALDIRKLDTQNFPHLIE